MHDDAVYPNFARVMGAWFDFPFSTVNSIRHVMFVHPYRTLAKVAVVLMLCVSYALHVCERAASSGVRSA
jgi:hypothetical protein